MDEAERLEGTRSRVLPDRHGGSDIPNPQGSNLQGSDRGDARPDGPDERAAEQDAQQDADQNAQQDQGAGGGDNGENPAIPHENLPNASEDVLPRDGGDPEMELSLASIGDIFSLKLSSNWATIVRDRSSISFGMTLFGGAKDSSSLWRPRLHGGVML